MSFSSIVTLHLLLDCGLELSLGFGQSFLKMFALFWNPLQLLLQLLQTCCCLPVSLILLMVKDTHTHGEIQYRDAHLLPWAFGICSELYIKRETWCRIHYEYCIGKVACEMWMLSAFLSVAPSFSYLTFKANSVLNSFILYKTTHTLWIPGFHETSLFIPIFLFMKMHICVMLSQIHPTNSPRISL